MTLTTPLAIHQSLTAAFIAEGRVSISLTPQAIQVQSNGSKKLVAGPVRKIQDFRLIPTPFDQQRPTVLTDGVERIISYTLLGKHDADMAVWDTWTDTDGTIYLIVAMAEGFGYEKKGLVERRLPVG